ncbi:MAG: hypothetical protein M3N98_06830 [Actinomycetota bacterium]|nr:hypothetical protein [Actinomycetota bacterium]
MPIAVEHPLREEEGCPLVALAEGLRPRHTEGKHRGRGDWIFDSVDRGERSP